MAPKPDLLSPEELRARNLALALAVFSARAGHDLTGPLSQASSLLALFIQRHGESNFNVDSLEAQQLLGFLQTAAARMHSVVGAVRQFCDIAAAEPRFRTLDSNTALEAAKQRLEGSLKESRVEITGETLPNLTANGDQIGTLFEVLLANSIKFRRPEEPARIHISARLSEGRWIFTVADNGIGIPAESHEAVFLPFRRLHGREYPGVGMGLATAKLIVGLHGGDIHIEPVSQTAPGTAVIFTMPEAESRAR